jgi:putative membrane protein
MVMKSFDIAAHARIESAIAEVESRSAGELVVATVPASDGYHDLRFLYAAALALSFAALVHVARPELSVTWLLWLEMGFAIVTWRVLGIGPLVRSLVPVARIEHSVQRRAREAFLEHELFATRDRSGVLILISELEHRVVILGDSGIHGCMPAGAWEAHVARIVNGFRSGQPVDGVCTVISELGSVLAEHFPARADDTNELPNKVRSEPR